MNGSNRQKKTAGNNKPAARQSGRGKRSGGKREPPKLGVEWLRSIVSPFGSSPCGIPDDRTTPSGKLTSRVSYTGAFNALAGTSSTHSFGLVLPPYPYYAYLNETSAGNGTLSDLDATGVNYVYAASTGSVPAPIPNLAGMLGGSGISYAGRIRCSSIGVQISYAGTELNRSGRYTAALATIGSPAYGVATTGTRLSCLSTLVSSVTTNYQTLWTVSKQKTTSRVTDGTFSATWKPSGTPSYQNTATDSSLMTFGVSAGAGAVGVTPSVWSADMGGWGTEGGQNALVILVDGDTTSAAQVSSNSYTIDIEWHWEVVPEAVENVVYALTPSRYSPAELAATLNELGNIPVARTIRAGTSGSYPF